MDKKKIIILIVVFISVLLLSTFITGFLLKNSGGVKSKESDVLKLEKYSLKYGKYKGYETEYNHEKGKKEKKEITITLTKDKINGELYEVKGNKIYINNFEMYDVIANNKFVLLAGEGVEFVYEG